MAHYYDRFAFLHVTQVFAQPFGPDIVNTSDNIVWADPWHPCCGIEHDKMYLAVVERVVSGPKVIVKPAFPGAEC